MYANRHKPHSKEPREKKDSIKQSKPSTQAKREAKSGPEDKRAVLGKACKKNVYIDKVNNTRIEGALGRRSTERKKSDKMPTS